MKAYEVITTEYECESVGGKYFSTINKAFSYIKDYRLRTMQFKTAKELKAKFDSYTIGDPYIAIGHDACGSY